MTTLREASQQALEALEMLAQPTKTNNETPRYKAHKAAITALRAALAQQEQEQEPVAWVLTDLDGKPIMEFEAEPFVRLQPSLVGPDTDWTPLYTTPPRREWRGLTMQEINALPEVGGRMWNMGSAVAVLRAIRAVEQALKEKNNG